MIFGIFNFFLETSWNRGQTSNCKTLWNRIYSWTTWRNSLLVEFNLINWIKITLKQRISTWIWNYFLDILARPSGTSIDWAYGTQNVPFSYLLEFRDKGAALQQFTIREFFNSCFMLYWYFLFFSFSLTIILGHHGFLLPNDQIIPNSLEIIDGLVAMIKEAEK